MNQSCCSLFDPEIDDLLFSQCEVLVDKLHVVSCSFRAKQLDHVHHDASFSLSDFNSIERLRLRN
jgi:hypothetical protein